MNETAARQLTDVVRQTAFEAHTFLRHGHNERVCENSLRKEGLSVERQQPIEARDEDGSVLGEFIADLVVNGELVVELEAARALVDEHVAQVLGYLRASRREHALLLNFGALKIQFQKLILRNVD